MKLVIFDLDGVVVSTDQYHYLAWKAVADSKGFSFDEEANHLLRGVSRAESLQIILDANHVKISAHEFGQLLDAKNALYREYLHQLTPKDILPGVLSFITDLQNISIATAIGSSSKNTPLILEKIGMNTIFDVVIDGNQVTHTKPDPEVFLKGAAALGIQPRYSVVVEDAQAGIDAANAGGFFSLGAHNTGLTGFDFFISSLEDITVKQLMTHWRTKYEQY